MEMAQLMQLLKERQGEVSNEAYANKMDIRGATLHRYYNGDREIGLDVLRKMFRFYRQQGDGQMIQALGAYALELQPDEIQISPKN